ncbi:MAG TPA: LapA family protein [Candidatus Cloacimonadota bacterium]|nr:LapA family protein [Candidatus Cloacimonadota bacterium]
MKFKTILILLLFVLIVIIFVQNTEVVDFKVYFWKLSMSRIILYPAILVIGFIIGYITAKINRRKLLKNKIRKLSEQTGRMDGNTQI